MNMGYMFIIRIGNYELCLELWVYEIKFVEYFILHFIPLPMLEMRQITLAVVTAI